MRWSSGTSSMRRQSDRWARAVGAGWPPESGGFTLLEILVAITILGLVLVTVYGSITRVIYAKERAEERAQLASVGREAVMRIADEIESAMLPSPTSGAVFQGASGGGAQPTDQVRFAIMSRPPFGPLGGRGGPVVVTYSLDAVAGREPVFLLRRDEVPLAELPPEGEEGPQPLSTMVLDGVAGLRFRYWDPYKREWVGDWDSTQPDYQDRLPLLVEVALFLYDSERAVHDFATIVDLPLATVRPTPTPGP